MCNGYSRRFSRTVAISRQKEDRSGDYDLLLANNLKGYL